MLVGEPWVGGFTVRAVWRAGAFGWDDRAYRNGAWPHEKAWLKELDRGRASGWAATVGTRRPAAVAYPTRWADRQTAFWVNLLNVPRGKQPRLGRIAAQVAILSGVVALLAAVRGGVRQGGGPAGGVRRVRPRLRGAPRRGGRPLPPQPVHQGGRVPLRHEPRPPGVPGVSGR